MKGILISITLLLCIFIATDSWAPLPTVIREYKLDRNGLFNPKLLDSTGTLQAPLVDIDFDQTVAGTLVDGDGSGNWTMTVNSVPVKKADGTWPTGPSGSQGNGWSFDGTDDQMSCADANCDGDPAGSFSFFAVITPMDITGAHYIMAKYYGANDHRGWAAYTNGATFVITLSKDGAGGGSLSTAQVLNCARIGQMSIVGATYTYVGDGSSTLVAYCDNLATSTTSSAVGPVFNTADPTYIGSNSAGASHWKGRINHVTYWDGFVYTEAQFDIMRAQYRGRTNSMYQEVEVSCASCPAMVVAPPGSGTEPFIIRSPVNEASIQSPASTIAGLGNYEAITNLLQRSAVCETQDGSNHPQGWVTNETASAIDCVSTTSATGKWSVKYVHNDPADISEIGSACITTGIGTDIYLESYAKKDSGTAQLLIGLYEYAAADCSGAVLAASAVTGPSDLTTSWAVYGGAFPAGSWNGGTNGYRFGWYDTGDDIIAYVDAPLLRQASTSIIEFATCTSDADATAVCNGMYGTIAKSPFGVGGTYEVEFDFYSNWDGDDGNDHWFVATGMTGANEWGVQKTSGDELQCVWVTGGGSAKNTVAAVTSANWPANTSLHLKCRRQMGNIYGFLDGTAHGTQYTSADLTQTAVTAPIGIGSVSAGHSNNGVTSNIFFNRRATLP